LHRQGLRPIQISVPDVRSPAFSAEAHRQTLAGSNSPHAQGDQAFIDAISDWGGA
jgi:antidote-toxin recognition MazE-like antitoxin